MTRNDFVAIAKKYIGYSEADGRYKTIIDGYNAHTPIGRGYKVQYSDPWCATFVSFCMICAGMSFIPTECSCYYLMVSAQKNGYWIENDGYIPAPGDFILYDWQDTGVGDNTGMPDHIGIIETVNGNAMTVIEGNYNDAVGRRTFSVNGKYIRGYIVPPFDDKKSITITGNTTKELLTQIVDMM